MQLSDISVRDRFITKTGQIYVVKSVYHSSIRLRATSVDCMRGRPSAPAYVGKATYDFIETDLDWLSELTHEVFTTIQESIKTKYWVSAQCFMDDERVSRSVYRMSDSICDDGTSNLTEELAEVAAQLDRDSYQISEGKREALYNRVVIEVNIEQGQHARYAHIAADQLATS